MMIHCAIFAMCIYLKEEKTLNVDGCVYSVYTAELNNCWLNLNMVVVLL